MTHPAVLPLEVETWRPIPGHSGYEASQLGQVRSLRSSSPRVLVGSVGPCGFRTVKIVTQGGGDCRRVGSLVALAWIGPLPEGAEVRRLDGDTLNDRADNLAYGSLEEVHADHAARARREEATGAPTHCPQGHRYADRWLGNWGHRLCQDCRWDKRVDDLARKKRNNHDYYLANRRPKKPPVTQCADCGTDVVQRRLGSLFKRCTRCRDAARKEAERRYRARRGKKPPRVSYCIDCGAKVLNNGPGPMAKRCKPHQELAQREPRRRYDQKRRDPEYLVDAAVRRIEKEIAYLSEQNWSGGLPLAVKKKLDWANLNLDQLRATDTAHHPETGA